MLNKKIIQEGLHNEGVDQYTHDTIAAVGITKGLVNQKMAVNMSRNDLLDMNMEELKQDFGINSPEELMNPKIITPKVYEEKYGIELVKILLQDKAIKKVTSDILLKLAEVIFEVNPVQILKDLNDGVLENKGVTDVYALLDDDICGVSGYEELLGIFSISYLLGKPNMKVISEKALIDLAKILELTNDVDELIDRHLEEIDSEVQILISNQEYSLTNLDIKDKLPSTIYEVKKLIDFHSLFSFESYMKVYGDYTLRIILENKSIKYKSMRNVTNITLDHYKEFVIILIKFLKK